MKAVVINGPGELAVVEKEKPRPGPGEVLVKIEYCGICGSDLHAYSAGFFPPGVTIGHEFAGLVAEAGSGCGSWAVGQKVTGNNIITCGHCSPCLKGNENLCPEMRRLGITDEGALAEYLLMPANSLCRVPEEVPLELFALSEPLSVALHAVNQSVLRPNMKTLIIGAGAIGLCLLALLKRRAPGQVAVVEPNPIRAETAVSLGATTVISGERINFDAEVGRFTGGKGADLVFECAGIPETIRSACSFAAARATVVVLGICHQPVEIDFLSLVTGEINIKPAFGKSGAEFNEAVELISTGAVDLKPLISKIIPLGTVEEAFGTLAPDHPKILVAPNRG